MFKRYTTSYFYWTVCLMCFSFIKLIFLQSLCFSQDYLLRTWLNLRIVLSLFIEFYAIVLMKMDNCIKFRVKSDSYVF
ncbi:putative membrane protein [Erwinia amylovora ATCC 49946]|nr:putative membrane protein [Erwinia amylovora ATCC 49946]